MEECVHKKSGRAFAVKILEKTPGFFVRTKVLKEIETYHICRGHENIIQLQEYFEEPSNFYLIFEKIDGGSLSERIRNRDFFTEDEVSRIVKDLAT